MTTDFLFTNKKVGGKLIKKAYQVKHKQSDGDIAIAYPRKGITRSGLRAAKCDKC